MFASATLTEHLFRGLVGISALLAALTLSSESFVYPLVLLPIGFVALRGCPTCWLMGLGETILAKERGTNASADACVDGSCAVRRRPPKPSMDRMFRDLLGR